MTAARSLALDEAMSGGAAAVAGRSLWQDGWRRLRRNRFAMFGAGFTLIVIVVGVVSIFWTPYPTWLEAVGPTYEGFSPKHPLGLDTAGRDILSRTMQGAAISLEVGLGTAAMSSVFGIAIGLVAGYFRGWVDTVISFVISVWYGVPDLLVVMMFVLIFQHHELIYIIAAISITSWLNIARMVRGQTLSLREREFVEAARAAGTRDWRIILRHILPNSLGPIIVQATYLVPAAILFEAFLSFLGQGVPPPTPSWGAMCYEGYQSIQIAPHILLVPAVALSLTVLALTGLGDGLRDAFDPRMKR